MTAAQTHIVCASCATVNRAPEGKSLSHGKCGKCGAPLSADGPIDVAPGAVEKILTRDTGDMVIDAWAAWCGPCRMMAPHYAAVARRYGGNVRFLKIDVEAAPDAGRHLDIRGIPALFIRRGGRTVSHKAGLMQERDLQAWVGGVLGPPAA